MTTSAEAELAAAVQRGAAALDLAFPHWWDRIDVSRLNLSDTCQCVMGQLSPAGHLFPGEQSGDLFMEHVLEVCVEFEASGVELPEPRDYIERTEQLADYFGFDRPASYPLIDGYNTLDRLWGEAIRARGQEYAAANPGVYVAGVSVDA